MYTSRDSRTYLPAYLGVQVLLKITLQEDFFLLHSDHALDLNHLLYFSTFQLLKIPTREEENMFGNKDTKSLL